MSNQTIDGVLVSRALLEKLVGPGMEGSITDDEWDDLRALLDAPVKEGLALWQSGRDGMRQERDAFIGEASALKADNEKLAADRAALSTELESLRVSYKSVLAQLDAAQHQGEPVAQKYDDTLLPFVALMRKELHANAGKGDRQGWLAMSSDTCLLEIIYHFGKLQKAVKKGEGDGMAEYAADVANMCMMLLDICGALAFVEQPAPVAVVLPERNVIRIRDAIRIDGTELVQVWNACLDEVKRLNP